MWVVNTVTNRPSTSAVNENASANLAAAIASANASYDGSLAVTAYTASARNENG